MITEFVSARDFAMLPQIRPSPTASITAYGHKQIPRFILCHNFLSTIIFATCGIVKLQKIASQIKGSDTERGGLDNTCCDYTVQAAIYGGEREGDHGVFEVSKQQ